MPPPPPPGRAAGAGAARAAALWPLLFLLLRPCSAAAQRPEEPAQDEGNAADSWFGPELGLMYKVISECSRQPDLWLCLKLKALWTLERARAARGPLPLAGYLSLAPDPEEEPSSAAVEPPPDTEAQLEEQLPRDLGQRQARVDALLVQSADRLLRSRALQITLPASVFEGRGKKKDKYGGMMLAAGAAMAGMFLQVAMGKIALLAGKALLVAKIALVLSTVIGLKKLVGGGGGGGGGGDHQVVYAGDGHGGGGGGWGRRNLDEEAHLMAYSAQQPQGRAAARGQREGGPVGAGVEGSIVGEGGAGTTGDVEGDQSLNNRLR